METAFTVQGHPTTDMLEEYAFNRLSEADLEAMEEHLLVCPKCQVWLAEVDEYISLMKHVTAHSALSRHGPPTAKRWSLGRPIRAFSYALGAAALAACAWLTLTSRANPTSGSQ